MMFREKEKSSDSSHSSSPSTSTRKLGVRDVALGLGRKATAAELEEYLNRPHGASIPLSDAIKSIKTNLQKKRKQRTKWK